MDGADGNGGVAGGRGLVRVGGDGEWGIMYIGSERREQLLWDIFSEYIWRGFVFFEGRKEGLVLVSAPWS